MDNFEIGKVFWGGIYNQNWGTKMKWLEDSCKEKNIPIQIVKQGDVLKVGEVSFKVLWPEKGNAGKTFDNSEDLNNHSVVVRLDYKNHSALFTGDLYKAGEEAALASVGDQLDVDFLKVCHHGHGTSSSAEFVNAVSPKLAVATGFVDVPESVKNAFITVGAKLLYDQYNGYIHVSSDGEAMEYDTAQTRAKEQKK